MLMSPIHSTRLVLVVLLAASLSSFARADRELVTIELPDGGDLRAFIVTPDGFDPAAATPVVLAFPPGRQTQRMAKAGLDRYWASEAQRRGWVVVAPIAARGRMFYRSGSEAIGPLLDYIDASFNVQGGRVHAAGPSNGGRSAFRAALDHPDRIASVIAAPGYPPEVEDRDHLDRLVDIPVRMYGGAMDAPWVEEMVALRDALDALGGDVSLLTFENEGHTPPSVSGPMLFEALVDAHEVMMTRTPPPASVASASDADVDTPLGASDVDIARAAVNATVDRLHRAASEADEDVYFNLFLPDAVFLGTDPAERWTLDEFRRYAMPYFQRDTAWTYTPVRRSVGISPDGRAAWFEETLANDKLGACRGSGTLVRTDDGWRIAQYNLSVPVPNDLMLLFVEMIREHEAAPGDG